MLWDYGHQKYFDQKSALALKGLSVISENLQSRRLILIQLSQIGTENFAEI